MDTIKAMMIRKLQQKRNSNEVMADYIVREMILRRLKDICCLLPNDTSAGREFAGFMNQFLVIGNPKAHKMLVGKEVDAIVDKAITALLEKIMTEPDDLDDCYYEDYKHLRLQLVNEINNMR